MSPKTFLDEVYDARSPEALQRVYDTHAEAYEAELIARGYVLPERIAAALAEEMADRAAPILDFGCGTGLSGKALAKYGFECFDGLDVSAAMLRQADAKSVYRTLSHVSPGAPVPLGYGAIIASGAISVGAAPPETMDLLVAALGPEAYLVLSYNDHTLADTDYMARLEGLSSSGLTLLSEEHGPSLPGISIGATVYVFQREADA